MKKLDIPFVASRGFECGQACAAMIIKYFKPNFEPDFDQFNRIIRHKAGKYTFPPQLAIILDNFGIASRAFSSDDIKKFDEDYYQFKRWFGKDFEHEMKYVDKESFDFMVDEFRRINLFEVKKSRFADLLNYFKAGSLVGLPVDWNTLIGKEGHYAGHFVVISGLTRDKVLIHDPDVGPFMVYDLARLKKAWQHPAIANDFIVAFGKK